MDIKDNEIKLLKEDLWCVHKYLDDLDLPREDIKGEQFSIAGRIKQLEKRFNITASDLETLYLRNEA